MYLRLLLMEAPSESLAKSIRTIYNIRTTDEFQVIISKVMVHILS